MLWNFDNSITLHHNAVSVSANKITEAANGGVL